MLDFAPNTRWGRNVIGKLLFAAAIAVGVGYGYPLWNEGTHTTCQALERRFIAMAGPAGDYDHPGHALAEAMLRDYVQPLSDGRIAAAEVKQRYPALPASVGCAVSYWSTLLDPRVQTYVREAIR
jgi:hypothetical protein